MSEIDRAELRRLLDEATPRPWTAEGSQIQGPDRVLVAAVREHSTTVDRPDALIIAAAVNALPDLLNALEKAEGHRGSLAQAWEEGFYAGAAADMGDWEHPPEIIPNPYRQEVDQ